ncbi:AAA family ATPase [Sodalis sp. RH14]|uniref:AAA family ATPase n=1 Tax=Sodalis sp. RH14 TaxID=3394329 RepID=UPI0039B5EEEB
MHIQQAQENMNRLVVISGCSGGGKSTLLAELKRRGYTVVEEPGRRVVSEELKRGGQALPWIDMAAFLRNVIQLSITDWTRAGTANEWIFFDRGVVDAAASLEHITGKPYLKRYGISLRYHHKVFLTPPWAEIYAEDPERRHSFDAALAEYGLLVTAYPALDYDILAIPKTNVADRATFVLDALSGNGE